MALGFLAPVVGGILGGLSGAQGQRASATQTETINLQDINQLNRGRSQLEAATQNQLLQGFGDIQSLVGMGPGAQQVQEGLAAQQSLASRIQQVLNQGGLDVSGGQQFAQQIFQPQQVAMQQAFEQQGIEANRLAARLGRAGNDPILRNRLAQEQTRQQAMLQAQQGAFAAQQAQALPQMQLGYAEALANVRGGLASQAFSNRQTLMQMGQQLSQAERNYRLAAANRTTSETGSEGGGTAGAISGALAGIGAAPQFARLGQGVFNGLRNMFGNRAAAPGGNVSDYTSVFGGGGI